MAVLVTTLVLLLFINLDLDLYKNNLNCNLNDFHNTGISLVPGVAGWTPTAGEDGRR